RLEILRERGPILAAEERIESHRVDATRVADRPFKNPPAGATELVWAAEFREGVRIAPASVAGGVVAALANGRRAAGDRTLTKGIQLAATSPTFRSTSACSSLSLLERQRTKKRSRGTSDNR